MFRPKAMPCLIGSIVLSAVFLMGHEVCIGSTPDLSGVWDLSGGSIRNTVTCGVLDPVDFFGTASGTILIYQENTESPAEFTFSSTGTQYWDSGPIEYDLFGPGTVDAEGAVTMSHDSGPGVDGCTPTSSEISYHGDSDGCTLHFYGHFDSVCNNGCTIETSSSATAIKQTGAQEGPFGDATCSDGWDNDCDGWVDGKDSDCGGGPCTGSPTASTLGASPVHGASDLTKHLAYFMLPLGAMIGLMIWRRKR